MYCGIGLQKLHFQERGGKGLESRLLMLNDDDNDDDDSNNDRVAMMVIKTKTMMLMTTTMMMMMMTMVWKVIAARGACRPNLPSD